MPFRYLLDSLKG